MRNVIVIIWMEELEKLGKGLYDLVAYMDALHLEACISPVHDQGRVGLRPCSTGAPCA